MKIKYDRHTSHYLGISLDAARAAAIGKTSPDTMNLDRERRKLRVLMPFFKHAACKSWLTVGDGAYGSDAIRFAGFGISDVHASDLTDHLLRQVAERGLIKQYSAQNAEAMSFSDDFFDIVFCKESYHHFPRPVLAVYEMLRVCRDAVILVEPPDFLIAGGHSLRRSLQRLFGKSFYEFEDVGNFVYSVSERELEKLLLGLGLRHCAFCFVNDFYRVGMEQIPMEGGDFSQSLSRLKIRALRFLRDMLCEFRILSPNLLVSILFKRPPTPAEVAALKKGGFRIRELPLNPYTS